MTVLICKCMDCGTDYIIEENEQTYYLNHGFEFPKRCAYCRKLRRLAKELEAKNGKS